MGFQEKSAWACTLAILGVYVPYFVIIFQLPMLALGLFWVAAFGLMGLLTLFHVLNAVFTNSIRQSGDVPPLDELDQRIEVAASKWAGFVLAFAVMSWLLVAMYALPVAGFATLEHARADGADPSVRQLTIPVIHAMWAIHWLFAGFVIANVVYYAGIIVGYRRLARG